MGAARKIPPQLWAVLDDCSWLIFRLFGVNARPRIRGVDPRDMTWDAHFPWFCARLHNRTIAHTGDHHACRLFPATTDPLPARGKCGSGLIFRSMPVSLGPGFDGTLVLGPFLNSPPTEHGLVKACRKLGLSVNEESRWDWGETPVLSPARERDLLRFSKSVFLLARDRFSGKAAAESRHIQLENIYPPLRLADDNPLHIYGVYVGYWETESGSLPAGVSSTCDLQYIDRGTGKMEIGGKTNRIEQGQAVLVLPEMRFSLNSAKPPEKCEVVSISFVANASLLEDIAGRPLTLDAFQQTLLSRLCRISAPRDEPSFRSSEAKLLLVQFLLSLRRSPMISGPEAAASLPPPAYRRTQRTTMAFQIRSLIEQSAEKRIQLGKLSRDLHISVREIQRIFKADSGTSPLSYHRKLRIKRAELLLRHSMLTVSQIASRLGYNSAFHFSNAFKKEVGLSPTEFARSTRSIEQQVDRARALLTEKGKPVHEIAVYLGFPNEEAFVKAFIHYQGVSPRKYAEMGRDVSAERARLRTVQAPETR